jgi:hypothetical protein
VIVSWTITSTKGEDVASKKTRKKVGVIGVDAGLCWLGDPCYIIHSDDKSKDLGADWSDFVDKMCPKELKGGGLDHRQFNFNMGHAGLGVCVSTGYGDGTYPVFATFNEDGRVVKVEVEFD